MNKTILMGRLTKDPEQRYTSNNTAVCSFTVAVDRKFKKDGEQQADFIGCQAWSKTAEFISKYFQKGSAILIVGRLQTRNWEDNDGKKHYVTEVVAEEVEFAGGKKEQRGDAHETASQGNAQGDYDTEDELPF